MSTVLAAPHAHELRRRAGTRGALFWVEDTAGSGGNAFLYARDTAILSLSIIHEQLTERPRRWQLISTEFIFDIGRASLGSQRYIHVS